jgi:hypothetical protein
MNVVYDENVNVMWFTSMKNDVHVRRDKRSDLFKQVFFCHLGNRLGYT